jgi:multicomponent Na+:H+ antiporter subunit D
LAIIWLILQFASAGVFHHAGIKVPYFTFFGHDSGIRAKEPPLNMLIAMGIAAFLCIFIGLFPSPLYYLLPYPVDYIPYTGAHVVSQLQLLMFGALAFCLLILSGHYPAEMRAINLDTDWFYRKGASFLFGIGDKLFNGMNRFCDSLLAQKLPLVLSRIIKEGVAGMTLVFLIPFRFWKGAGKEDIVITKQRVHAAFETGSTPIGLCVATVALLIVVIFFLC